MPETEDHLVRRLHMRSIRRGIKEMDLILGNFAENHLRDLPPGLLETYGAMLEETDHDLYAWVSGQTPAPPQYSALIGRIQTAFRPLADSKQQTAST